MGFQPMTTDWQSVILALYYGCNIWMGSSDSNGDEGYCHAGSKDQRITIIRLPKDCISLEFVFFFLMLLHLFQEIQQLYSDSII